MSCMHLVYPHFHDFYPFACQAYVFITNFHAGLKYHSPAGILIVPYSRIEVKSYYLVSRDFAFNFFIYAFL